MGVIFDLDQTLIDSRAAESLRKSREWAKVYAAIPSLIPFPGVPGLLSHLAASGVPVGIVTSSPASYCNKVVAHWRWKIDAVIGYHDTALRKPAPDPILLALTRIKREKDKAISVGDDPRDIVASRKAGVYVVGALWGAADRVALIASAPDALCESVPQLVDLLCRRLSIPSPKPAA